jgi:hypothetical protein
VLLVTGTLIWRLQAQRHQAQTPWTLMQQQQQT